MRPNKIKISTNISLFLISFSIFLYQVCLLRIISISDYYHFAFLIVSIALLGFGISGSFLYFFISRIKDRNLILLIFSFSFAVSVFISYMMINLIPFDSFKIAWELKQVFYLFAYYFFLLLPFFFGGSFIGYIFYDEEKPQITYFYNLIGSAAGAIGFLFLVQPAGKTGVVLISVGCGIAATFLVVSGKYLKLFISMAVIFTVLVSAVFIFLPASFEVRMSPFKSLPTLLRIPGSEVIYSEENAVTRIDVVESPSIKSVPGMSLKYEDLPPSQHGLTEDGDNLTPLTYISSSGFKDKKLKFFNYCPLDVIFKSSGASCMPVAGSVERSIEEQPGAQPGGPAKQNTGQDILIIEPGGGLDVQGCLYLGGNEDRITVLQNNRLMVDALKTFDYYRGNIYSLENVRLVETSSRNYCKTTDGKFDLIILSLSDSFHPVSSGAYSLNENYIYTVESFKELIRITDDSGIFAVTRWVQVPPSEGLKVISILTESLEQSNIGDIPGKIFAFRSWSTVTVIFKKIGFSANETEVLKARLSELNYDLIYCAGVEPQETNIYNLMDSTVYHDYYKKIIEGNKNEREDIYEDYYFNIEPTDDNRPYFYDFFKIRQIPDVIKYFGKSTQPFGGGGYLVLLASLLISVILSLLLIILPLSIRRIKINMKSDYKFLLYFTALGFGFFFVELPLIQKFILILGNPAYSVAVILFALMLSAGFGSFTISRIKINMNWVVIFIVIYVGAFIFLSGFIQDFIIVRSLWQRFIFSILIVLPLGFFMGMPFPNGIAIAKQLKPQIVPWLWAINGCASVVGSISAVIISIHFGFLAVLGVSALLYIGALVTYKRF